MVSTWLSDLKAQANDLASEKITVRKKADECLKSLLNNKNVIQLLDEDSSKEASPFFTWTQLWQAVVLYTHKEIDKWLKDLEKHNSKVNAGSSGTLMGKKSNVTSLMKTVLKKCDKCLINAETIINTLCAFLSVSMAAVRTKNAFGADIIDILLKRVFIFPKYCRGVSVGTSDESNQWNALVNIGFDLPKSNMDGLTFHLECEFLHRVIQLSNNYSSTWKIIQGRLDHFIMLLESEKLQRSSSDTKLVVLKMVNFVQDLLKRENRHLLCKVGEKTVNSVLGLYEESKTSEEVIKFFRMQMSLHHPLGARNASEGAHFFDQENNDWAQNLARVYANLIDTHIANRKRQNRHRGTKNYELDESMLDLAKQICRQLFFANCLQVNSDKGVDLTQIIPLDTTQTQMPPAKRRRMEVTFKSNILDKLKRNLDEEEEVLVPWLQIVSVLVSSLEEDLELCNTAFKCILDLLKTCRTTTVKEQLFKCCIAFLKSHSNFDDWPFVWDATVNSIGLNQCMNIGHALLRGMMDRNLDRNLDDLIRLYLQKRINCRNSSILTLLWILQKRPLLIAKSELGRHDLLSWVTGISENGDESEHVSSQHWDLLVLQQDCHLPRLLLSLMMHPTCSTDLRPSLTPKEDTFEELERKILETCQVRLSRVCLKSEVLSKQPKLVLCERMKSKTKDVLIQKSGGILQKLQTDPDAQSLNLALCHSKLVLTLLDLPSSYGLAMTEKRLLDVALNLLDKSITLLTRLVSASEHEPTITVLDHWTSFLREVKHCKVADLDVRLTQAGKAINGLLAQISLILFKEKKAKPREDELDDLFVNSDDDDFDLDNMNATSRNNSGDMDVEMKEDEDQESRLGSLLKKTLIALSYTEAGQAEKCLSFLSDLAVKHANSDVLTSEAIIKCIFQGIEAFIDGLKSRTDYEANHEVLPILQKLARVLCSKKNEANFDAQLMKFLIKSVANSVGHLSEELRPMEEDREQGWTTDRNNVTRFAMGFVQLQKNYQRFSLDLQVELCSLFANLAAIGLSGISPKNYQSISHDDHRLDLVEMETLSCLLALSKFSRNPSHFVREAAIELLHRLLRDHLFTEEETVLHHIRESMDNWNFDDLDTDGHANLVASKLLVLLPLVHLRPSSELKVLQQIIKVAIRHSMPHEPLKAVFSTLSPERLPKEYLKPYLDHLICDVLSYCGDIQAFPYGLFADSFDKFIQENEQSVVPVLLWHYDCSKHILARLCKILAKKERALLVDNFIALSAIYLPDICVRNETREPKNNPMLELMYQVLTEEKHHQLLNDKFAEILGLALKRLDDDDSARAIFQMDIFSDVHLFRPVQIFPSLTVIKVQKVIEHLRKYLQNDSESTFFASLTTVHQDVLQRLFSEVCQPLKAVKLEDPKVVVALHGLFVILELVADELKTDVSGLDSCMDYLSWFILHCLVDLLKTSKSETIQLMAIKVVEKVVLIHAFLDDNWAYAGNAIAETILPITNALVDQCLAKSKSMTPSLNLLHLLIIENGHKLRSLKCLVGPFPREPMFSDLIAATSGDVQVIVDKYESVDLEKSLLDELKHFVLKKDPGMENLRVLSNKLRDSRLELASMQSALKGLGFSEDADSSVLHQAIKILVRLSKDENKSDDLRVLANDCLGLVGPIDLNTMVLFSDSFEGANVNLVRHLLSYVIDHVHEASISAIFALKCVLSSKHVGTLVHSDEKFAILLRPFLKVFPQADKPSSSSLVIQEEQLFSAIQSINLCDLNANHDNWISHIVVKLLQCYPKVLEGHLGKASMFGRHLLPLALQRPKFCAAIFPCLVHDVLRSCPPIAAQLSGLFSTFFAKFYHAQAIKDKKCLESMLEMVKFLRCQSRGLDTPWEDNFWLVNINYLHVAYASYKNGEVLSTILFCDLWCQDLLAKTERLQEGFALSCLSTPLLDSLYDHFSQNEPNQLDDVKMCQSLLADSYLALGEKAAVDGCGSNRILDYEAQVQHLMRENHHSKAMAMFDAHLSLGRLKYKEGLLKAMRDAGFNHTLLTYQKGCMDSLTSWSDVAYDEAVDMLRKRSLGQFEDKVKAFSIGQSERLSNNGVMASVYESLADLKIITELKGIARAVDLERDESARLTFEALFNDKGQQYAYLKPVMSRRCSILAELPFWHLDKLSNSPLKYRVAKVTEIKKASIEAFVKNCLALCKMARENEDYNFAYRNLASMEHFIERCRSEVSSAVGSEASWKSIEEEMKYQSSLLFWAWGEKDIAKMQLKHVIKAMSSAENSRDLLPEALNVMGSWLWSSRSESADTILKEYYSKSVDLFEVNLEAAEKAKDLARAQKLSVDISEAYNKLGSFCDEQYTHMNNYMLSKDFEDKQAILDQISQDHEIRKKQGIDKEGNARTVSVILERNSKLDKVELENRAKEKISYLTLALENYAKALVRSDKHDMKMYRWISLWFANCQIESVNQAFGNWAQSVPEYKFVGLLYQLCARMTTTSSKFQDTLNSIIFRCGIKHPYHTLPILLALANSNAEEKEAAADDQNDRSKAATAMLKRLQNQDRNLSDLAYKTEKCSLALIELAYAPTPSKLGASGKHPIRSGHALLKLRDMENVLLPTHSLPVIKDGAYAKSSEFCGIQGFTNEFAMVGGVNAPKKISCIGTDGLSRPQLLKGRDDLRQDAVMQQVFGLMNQLLKESLPKSKLQMRTFKVVPLSQRSGILEWCVNTEPISLFLIGNGLDGAHARYNPGDISAAKCRERIGKVAGVRNNMEPSAKARRIQEFKDVCKLFKPVFRHFFYENFPSPEQHLERRLAFTRSCATSSMIGYVLGLGDRHIQNILIDKYSAEVVHIDLGIAFEQGKILPTPEMVPFRLTRDIIDGFGPCGVEGTFRKCAEQTLKVLRSNKESILTILEVLMFDPLYNWSLTPAKAYKIQFRKEASAALKKQWAMSSQSRNTNKLAERALLRVSHKLTGMEEGYHMSIEGQVNALIQQATDPANLAVMYSGWQAYV